MEGITTESLVDDGVEDASVEEDNDDCVLDEEVVVIESFPYLGYKLPESIQCQ